MAVQAQKEKIKPEVLIKELEPLLEMDFKPDKTFSLKEDQLNALDSWLKEKEFSKYKEYREKFKGNPTGTRTLFLVLWLKKCNEEEFSKYQNKIIVLSKNLSKNKISPAEKVPVFTEVILKLSVLGEEQILNIPKETVKELGEELVNKKTGEESNPGKKFAEFLIRKEVQKFLLENQITPYQFVSKLSDFFYSNKGTFSKEITLELTPQIKSAKVSLELPNIEKLENEMLDFLKKLRSLDVKSSEEKQFEWYEHLCKKYGLDEDYLMIGSAIFSLDLERIKEKLFKNMTKEEKNKFKGILNWAVENGRVEIIGFVSDFIDLKKNSKEKFDSESFLKLVYNLKSSVYVPFLRKIKKYQLESGFGFGYSGFIPVFGGATLSAATTNQPYPLSSASVFATLTQEGEFVLKGKLSLNNLFMAFPIYSFEESKLLFNLEGFKDGLAFGYGSFGFGFLNKKPSLILGNFSIPFEFEKGKFSMSFTIPPEILIPFTILNAGLQYAPAYISSADFVSYGIIATMAEIKENFIPYQSLRELVNTLLLIYPPSDTVKLNELDQTVDVLVSLIQTGKYNTALRNIESLLKDKKGIAKNPTIKYLLYTLADLAVDQEIIHFGEKISPTKQIRKNVTDAMNKMEKLQDKKELSIEETKEYFGLLV
ncbi:hypothetical protein JXB01_01170, partial [Candidatus Micrarchaeota archaeon]|nr:hypothetical protein [Candidatus Micrarchaeota archaeon]